MRYASRRYTSWKRLSSPAVLISSGSCGDYLTWDSKHEPTLGSRMRDSEMAQLDCAQRMGSDYELYSHSHLESDVEGIAGQNLDPQKFPRPKIAKESNITGAPKHD